MIIEIKHYNEKVSVEINEDQYKEHGLDETSAEQAVNAVLKLLSIWYSDRVVAEVAEQFAYENTAREQE